MHEYNLMRFPHVLLHIFEAVTRIVRRFSKKIKKRTNHWHLYDGLHDSIKHFHGKTQQCCPTVHNGFIWIILKTKWIQKLVKACSRQRPLSLFSGFHKHPVLTSTQEGIQWWGFFLSLCSLGENNRHQSFHKFFQAKCIWVFIRSHNLFLFHTFKMDGWICLGTGTNWAVQHLESKKTAKGEKTLIFYSMYGKRKMNSDTSLHSRFRFLPPTSSFKTSTW